jgi:hypothetical protein
MSSERSFTWSPTAELDAIRYGVSAAEIGEVFDAPALENTMRPTGLLLMQGTTSTGRTLRLVLEPHAAIDTLYVLVTFAEME